MTLLLPKFVCHRAWGAGPDANTCGQCVYAVTAMKTPPRQRMQMRMLTCAKTASPGHLNDAEAIKDDWPACGKFERRAPPARAA